MQPTAKKTPTPYEFVGVQKRSDFTLAMVQYNSRHSEQVYDPIFYAQNKSNPNQKWPRVWDLTAYIVFDYRFGVTLEDVAAKVIQTVLDDTVFMQMC